MKPPLSNSAFGLFAVSCAAATALTAVQTGESATPLTSVRPGVTLTVRASVTDLQGDSITYRWVATDGTVRNVNRPTTTWTLPPNGRGVHFLYLQASDGKGGYTEQRVVVATDGKPYDDSYRTSRLAHPTAPPAPPLTGGILRTWTQMQTPDIHVRLRNVLDPTVYSAAVTSDLNGQLVFPEVPANAVGNYGDYQYLCGYGADPDPVTGTVCGDAEALYAGRVTSDLFHYGNGSIHVPGSTAVVLGRVKQADGRLCGVRSTFFNTESAARVSVYDNAHNLLGGPVRVNTNGDYNVPANIPANGDYIVHVDCEGVSAEQPVTVDVSAADPATVATPTRGPDFTLNNTAPVVNSLVAYLNGTPLFWPAPPSGRPSELVPDPDLFLTGRGIDTRKDACAYYVAIGVVTSCGTNGELIGGITFDQWKQRVQMAPYNKSAEYVATFVNTVDLNLTRNHHATRVGPNQISTYVCNYLGPPDSSQASVDTAIDNALAGRNLVACVAMDYGVTPGVNGDQPFTKYTTFGPDGRLLPSVNLDGRGEKFTPANCVACHGGEKYAGNFRVGAAGKADLGAHFLPYDADNYAYSSKPGLGRADTEPALKLMNQLVLETSPSDATKALIGGWYGGCTAGPDGAYTCANPTQFADYLPPDWSANGFVSQEIVTNDATITPAAADTLAASMYHNVVKASCRTCHTAATAVYNLDSPSGDNGDYTGTGWDFLQHPSTTYAMVAGVPSDSYGRLSNKSHYMPNALVTFNRFWGSVGTAADQPATIVSIFGANWSRPSPMVLLPDYPDIDILSSNFFQ